MNLQIEIETGEDCLFKLTDLTEYDNFENTISVVIMTVHNSKLKDNTLPYVFIQHDKPIFNKIIPTNFDGSFTLTYLVVPNKVYDNYNSYTEYYYSDGEEIYKYVNGVNIKATNEELIKNSTKNTSISRIQDELVSICFIKKNFIDLCNKIYESRIFSKCSVSGKVSKDLINTRDLVWTYINLISYYTDIGYIAEALRLIESLTECSFKNNGI